MTEAPDYETIRLSIDNGVARITLHRPERLNAFTAGMHAELAAALDRIESTRDLRVLVLTGAGRGFCAGQDLADRRFAADEMPDLGASLEARYNPLVRRLVALPMPVVAAVNGVAAGAGANIALACDLVIATASARFVQPFAAIGLVPDSGGTWHLPRLVGQARALGLALTAEPIGAKQAAEWGLIWRAIEDDHFTAAVDELVAALAVAPTAALAAIKRAIRSSWTRDLDAQLDLERELQHERGLSADYREGVTAFLEKRSPQFSGH